MVAVLVIGGVIVFGLLVVLMSDGSGLPPTDEDRVRFMPSQPA